MSKIRKLRLSFPSFFHAAAGTESAVGQVRRQRPRYLFIRAAQFVYVIDADKEVGKW